MRYYHIVSVHCRTGSLEDCRHNTPQLHSVHCRTGSLEVAPLEIALSTIVHCRTGSLEAKSIPPPADNPGSLPHRQLRRLYTTIKIRAINITAVNHYDKELNSN